MKNGPPAMSLAMDLRLRERALSQWSDHRTYRTYVYVRTYPTVSTAFIQSYDCEWVCGVLMLGAWQSFKGQ